MILEKEEKETFYFDRICPTHEVFYLLSITYSSKRCLNAFNRYEYFKNQSSDAIDLISTIQEAIGHAAAVSRFFWPSRNGKNNISYLRGEKLRKAFYLNDHSALKNKDLRNTFEHFDEKLDEYLSEKISGHFYPSCIIGSRELTHDPAKQYFKLLDPDAGCLFLLGREFNFKLIHQEVKRIFEIANKAASNGGRVPR